jgi:hypothetical protein
VRNRSIAALARETKLSNEQAVVLAVAHLGGQLRAVHTEDVAMEVDRIAPERFRWRKYKEQINIELVHTALRDAKRKGGYVGGSGVAGWQLTPEGADLVERLEQVGAASAAARPSLDARERTWRARERGRLLAETAYQKWAESGAAGVTSREAERFFRLDDYVVGRAREERVQRLLSFFGSDPELGPAVKDLARQVTSR